LERENIEDFNHFNENSSHIITIVNVLTFCIIKFPQITIVSPIQTVSAQQRRLGMRRGSTAGDVRTVPKLYTPRFPNCGM